MGKTVLMMNNSLIGAVLTRAITVEQITANRANGPLRRHAEVRSINEEARTIEVAFSSEEPVSRWFGDEILDHSPGAMIETRLANGAAVLWNHNADVQIGTVESSSVDGDRRGRAVLRFGKSGRASEIWADILDGIIRHVSVGYFIRAIKTEERDGERDKVTVTEWEPFEISMVSVPADPSVGVGRAAGEPPEEAPAGVVDTGTRTIPTIIEGPEPMFKNIRNAAGDLVRVEVDADGNVIKEIEVLERASETQAMVTRGREGEQQRTTDLLALGEQYSAQSLAADAIRNNTSVEVFTRSLVDHVAGTDTGNRALDDNGGNIGMTDNEVDRFSFVRAARAILNPTDRRAQEAAAFEFECGRAAATEQGRDAQGIMVPMDVLQRALNTGTDGALAGNTGGLAIGTTLGGSFIEMLRASTIFLRLATPMGGLIGNYDMVGQAAGAQGFWLNDDEDTTEGAQELRNISLSPKTVGAFSEITRSTLKQTSVDTEALVRRDLAFALGATISLAGFYGTGGSQPLGLKNLPGINAVPFAATLPTFAELVAMEGQVAADNAAMESMVYCGNTGFRSHCKTTEKFAGSNGNTIWEPGNEVNGYGAEITTQIAAGDVFHGNFADAIVGMWGGLDLTVDTSTHSLKGRKRIVAFQDVDIAYRHAESFCYGAKPVV